ncbi:MAG TPA: acyl-CoA dehydrogenase family protein [Frankiaceae bacterium]|nr:acyl-CoA dehydrogenase family protein [Frankiaceae bacterium]
MNIDLSDEAREFGAAARRAIAAAGGDELVQQAEADPLGRAEPVASVLAALGAWELDPRSGPDELEAAAALCRAAGWWGLAYPVAERLCRPREVDADGMLVVSGHAPAAAVDGLDLRWTAVTLDGQRSRAMAQAGATGPRKSAFVTALELDPLDAVGSAEVALGIVLPCWTLLGMLDRALALTRTYVSEREQFGQQLSGFQGVQFQLTDAEVERAGVEELALYALWSVETGRGEALEDALAVRLAAIEAAEVVFRVAHQLHGAMGFCDETTLSWVSRYSQPLRRLPLTLTETRDELTRLLGNRALAGLFSGSG